MSAMVMQVVVILMATVIGEFGITCQKISDLKAAKEFLKAVDTQISALAYKYSSAMWNYATNMTDYNMNKMAEESVEYLEFPNRAARNISRFDITKMDATTKRHFARILDAGSAGLLDEAKSKRLADVKAEMQGIFFSATACITPEKCLPLTPDLENVLKYSRDYDTRLKAWTGWRNATGPKIRKLYPEYVTLSNEESKLIGHADMGARWRSFYDSPTFEAEVEAMFEDIRRLYVHIHGFVRNKLKKTYGKDKFPSTGHIPAHLIGDMFSENWEAHVIEFEANKKFRLHNFTEIMRKKKYTPKQMFEAADNFYWHYSRMDKDFWKNSMLEKPKDGRAVYCTPNAVDFSNRKDYRILMCTEVTEKHLEKAHHLMGHLQYAKHYKHQPAYFRDGANPAFHKAFGDAMTLSMTLEYMKQIGLIKKYDRTYPGDENILMRMALEKIVSLPYALVLDLWRWKVFRGEIKPEQYNEYWWKLRCKYQGISPPVKRTESDFDPAAKFEVPGNIPYINNFVANIFQFQIHKASCDLSGYRGLKPHLCSVYKNKQAAFALGQMMKVGASKPWPEAMKGMRNQTKLSAKPLLRYFNPLNDRLVQDYRNKGWTDECPKF